MSKNLLREYQRMRNGECCIHLANLPASLETAYQLQHLQTERLDVGAWKLGGTTSHTRNLFAVDTAYYGPIESSSVFVEPTRVSVDPKMQVIKGEAEVSFILSDKVADLPSYNLNNLNLYISHVCPSIELPWTMLELPKDGVNGLVADCCASGALVVGKPIPWTKELTEKLNGKVEIQSETSCITEGSVADIINGPLFGLHEFLSLARKHKLQLKPGQIVATGGCTSCEELPFNKTIKVDFECIGDFDFTLERRLDD